jgi:hypothetical protein
VPARAGTPKKDLALQSRVKKTKSASLDAGAAESERNVTWEILYTREKILSRRKDRRKDGKISLVWIRGVQGEVELEDVDAGFTEDSELAGRSVLGD